MLGCLLRGILEEIRHFGGLCSAIPKQTQTIYLPSAFLMPLGRTQQLLAEPCDGTGGLQLVHTQHLQAPVGAGLGVMGFSLLGCLDPPIPSYSASMLG